MPELPEVQIITDQLSRNLTGARIAAVDLRNPGILRPPVRGLDRILSGTEIRDISRKGKYIKLLLKSGAHLWFHLGMTGQLLWPGEKTLDDKHVHFVLNFQGTLDRLLFRDIRKFGRIIYSAADVLPKAVRKLGPEPFDIGAHEFAGMFKTRKGAIKSLLLNQGFMAGLGNIYADESLFAAGIHPRRRPYKISKKRLIRLHQAVLDILKQAMKQGGSSIENYRHINGESGTFQKYHQVYGQTGKKCRRCGHQIRKIILAGRSASFCAYCQT